MIMHRNLQGHTFSPTQDTVLLLNNYRHDLIQLTKLTIVNYYYIDTQTVKWHIHSYADICRYVRLIGS